MQQSRVLVFDRFMQRILFVKPAVIEGNTIGETTERDTQAENALTFSLMFSGIRCIFQYALFPFILPVIGVASNVAIPFLLLINTIAIVSIFFSLRRFWTIQYKHRWQYLFVAIVALVVLVAFQIFDIQMLQV